MTTRPKIGIALGGGRKLLITTDVQDIAVMDFHRPALVEERGDALALLARYA